MPNVALKAREKYLTLGQAWSAIGHDHARRIRDEAGGNKKFDLVLAARVILRVIGWRCRFVGRLCRVVGRPLCVSRQEPGDPDVGDRGQGPGRDAGHVAICGRGWCHGRSALRNGWHGLRHGEEGAGCSDGAPDQEINVRGAAAMAPLFH